MTHSYLSRVKRLKTYLSSTAWSLLLPLLVLVMLASPLSAHAATLPNLGTAKSFAVLASKLITNTGPTAVIGNVGTQSAAPDSVTGFPPGILVGTIHKGDAMAVQAQTDEAVAYKDAKGQTCTTDLTGQDLVGKTLTAGVYCFTSSATLSGKLTLSGPGVFIFQTVSTLTIENDSSVVLTNGASACNIFWQVGSSATLGTNSRFVGNILAQTAITAKTGAKLVGSLYARDAAVTLDTNALTKCA